MDLFDYMRENTMEKESPLASRLRPCTLDEVCLLYTSRCVSETDCIQSQKVLKRPERIHSFIR